MFRRHADPDARVPPGQHLTRGWPVLHTGPVPTFDPATWRFRVDGAVERALDLAWDELRALPPVRLTADLHCVTGWSKLDVAWEGVAFRAIADLAGPLPGATHALVHAPFAYSANVPLAALLDDGVLLAWAAQGKPLEPNHGGPLRLVVPKRYGWKSVKWVERIEVLTRDARGFWEQRGYHTDADPFREERYSWQEGD